MINITLVRGLPGSGKTTRAKNLLLKFPDAIHRESDMWFDQNGAYVFKPSELTNAHQWCVSATEMAIRNNKDVIVSNVFANVAECAPYFVLKQKYDCVMHLIACTDAYGSIHGVPPDKIEAMRLRFQCDDMIGITLNRDLSLFYSNPYDAYHHFLNNPAV